MLAHEGESRGQPALPTADDDYVVDVVALGMAPRDHPVVLGIAEDLEVVTHPPGEIGEARRRVGERRQGMRRPQPGSDVHVVRHGA